jgi:hypothetical protein
MAIYSFTNEGNEEVIEKWLDVIEMKDQWATKCKGAGKIKDDHYGLMANILETTVAGDIAGYNKVLIPMLRRAIPQNIAMDIAGIQPLAGPTGLIFYSYETYQNDTDTATLKRPASDSIIATLADATAFTVGGAISSTADAYVGVVRHKEGNNLLIDTTSGTLVVGVDVDNVASFVGSETTVSAVYENEVAFNVLFSNYSGPYATATAEALSGTMKELGLEVESATVTATSRALKVKWTDEMEEDFQALHNTNAQSWLSSAATREMVNSTNRELLNAIATQAAAGGTTAFDFESPAEGVDGRGRWEREIYENLALLINRTKMAIAATNKEGAGNFAVCSPNVLAALQSLKGFDDTGVDIAKSPYQGTILGLKLYVDLRATSDFINIGYKGGDETKAGVFYSPYKAISVKRMVAEESGQPRMIFKSRYAVTNNPYGATPYFRQITVTNIPTA